MSVLRRRRYASCSDMELSCKSEQREPSARSDRRGRWAALKMARFFSVQCTFTGPHVTRSWKSPGRSAVCEISAVCRVMTGAEESSLLVPLVQDLGQLGTECDPHAHLSAAKASRAASPLAH